MSHESAQKQILFPFLFLKTSKTPTRIFLPATLSCPGLGRALHRIRGPLKPGPGRSPLLLQVPELGERCKAPPCEPR